MNMKLNPLVKSSVVYMIGTAIGQGASLIAMIVFTRIMSTADYGRYSTYYAYMALIVPFVGANLYFAINNAYIDYREDIVAFRKSILFLSTIIMLIVLSIIGIFHRTLMNDMPLWIIIMAVIHAYSFFVVNYRKYSANMENDGKTKTMLLVLPETLQFAVPFVMLLTMPSDDYYVRVIGSTAGVFICALVAYVDIMRADGRLIILNYWRYALAISLPSIVTSISSLLMQQCDRVMITRLCGEEETAVYSVIYYLGYAILVVNQAISPVRQMWVYNRLGEGDTSQFRCMQKWYLFAIAGIEILLLMIAPEAIRLVFPSDYWKYYYIAPFMLSACIFVAGEFYSEIAMFHKRNTALSACVMLSAAVNIGLNAVLIPRYGAVAAAYTTVVGYLVAFLLYRKLANKYSPKVYSDSAYIVFILFSTLIAGIFMLVISSARVRYVIFSALLIVLIIYALLKKEEWIEYVQRGEKS